MIAAASDVAKKSGIRVLVRSAPAEEEHRATYIDAEGRATDLGKLSKADVESQSFRDAIASAGAARPPAPNSILVCTHGARDCRCGDIGGDLVAALRAEVEKRKSTIEIGELGHVGGHKWVSWARRNRGADETVQIRRNGSPPPFDAHARQPAALTCARSA